MSKRTARNSTSPVKQKKSRRTEPNEDADQLDDSASKEDLLKSLNEYLRNATKAGQCAIEGEADELPYNPGIEIQRFGPLALPLMDPQAAELLKRHSYEIDASLVSATNPCWQPQLDKFVSRVAQGLGGLVAVEAKFNKLIIRKQGSRISRHDKSVKQDRQFGTLLIQLPSIYSGGELILYDGSTKFKSIDFGLKDGKSQFSLQFAAYLDNFEYEITEVKSGYQLILVYSLLYKNGKNICWTKPYLSNKLFQVLSALNKRFMDEYRVCVVLKYDYDQKELTKGGVHRALRGEDQTLFDILNDVNKRLVDVDDGLSLSMYVWHVRHDVVFIDESEHDYCAGFSCNCETNDSCGSEYHTWEEWKKVFEIIEAYDLDGNAIMKKYAFFKM